MPCRLLICSRDRADCSSAAPTPPIQGVSRSWLGVKLRYVPETIAAIGFTFATHTAAGIGGICGS